jgi:hypothetical protein
LDDLQVVAEQSGDFKIIWTKLKADQLRRGYDQSPLIGEGKPLPTLKIPNAWFKDLFTVFESYNFTIDENTSIDIELSIDLEILGKIFENLLTEISPETGETARKSTRN